VPGEFLALLAAIADRQADFRSLGDTGADITTERGRLMLTVLGCPAELERELIRARTGERRARDVASNVRMGCKPKMTQHQIKKGVRHRTGTDWGDVFFVRASRRVSRMVAPSKTPPLWRTMRARERLNCTIGAATRSA
jgi:hypothetical protein